jgi:3-hydroxyisobutyrate dehydrogenase-like beta-hydroxyacid dehydrogenase
MSTKVGVIGLGAMGLPMARRLLQNGFELAVVPHRNAGPAEELAGQGARMLKRAADLAGECAVVITSVPDVPQVQEVLFGDGGLASNAHHDLLFIDMSTITPTAAREHYERLKAMGVTAVDAPVSGGPARASDGTLTIMVGADLDAYDRVLPVLRVLGKNITHVGPPGSGQAVKLVNQLMISIIMVANAEALTLGVKAGVPLSTMLDVISTSSGSNYLMQNWLTKTLFNDDLKNGFALDLLMKDLRAALSWAGELGLPSFGGALAQQLYRLARTEETARLDYSVVASVYEEAAGVRLRLERDDEDK